MDRSTCPQTSPLYFAGHLNGAANVSGLQTEAGVKVFLRRNGCGVGGTGCLLHWSLSETQAGLSPQFVQGVPTHPGLSRPFPSQAHPTVGGVLLGHPKEGLEWSLPG